MIAQAGVASRRKAESLIAEGAVSVNGETITTPGTLVDPLRDRISVNGRSLQPSHENVVVLLNKPKGYVCTKDDPEGRPVVYSLLPKALRHLFSVGRLDYHSEGALLLTTDGELANLLTHPKHHISKTYHVKFKGFPSREAIQTMRKGVRIDGKPTLPLDLRFLRATDNHCWYEIVLREGRNRQLRKMGLAVGFPILKIKRMAVGSISLGDLEPGAHRILDNWEIAALRKEALATARPTSGGLNRNS